ncbi:MAG TPA: hypothetical protein VEJ18_01210 [Planctomycetota bacterium]|nr:hypothetical protein [Planctomycetota bacterium]
MARTAAMLAILCASLSAQERGPRGGPPGPGLVEPRPGDKIAWYGTLEQARAEARRLNRPILLVSAAPHCHNVSGIW